MENETRPPQNEKKRLQNRETKNRDSQIRIGSIYIVPVNGGEPGATPLRLWVPVASTPAASVVGGHTVTRRSASLAAQRGSPQLFFLSLFFRVTAVFFLFFFFDWTPRCSTK